MQLRSALLAATVLAMPIAASAQPVTGLYVGAGAGVKFTQQENVKGLSFPDARLGVDRTGNLKIQHGVRRPCIAWVGASATGCGQKSKVTTATTISAASMASCRLRRRDHEQKFGAMVNVLYDFNGISPWFVPYIGAGVGYQRYRGEVERSITPATVAGARRPAASAATGSSGTRVRSPIRQSSVRPSRCRRSCLAWRSPPNIASWVPTGDRSYSGTALRPLADRVRHRSRSSWARDYNHCDPGRPALQLRRCAAAAAAGSGSGSGTGSSALLSGVLRLGQGDSDRPCAPDHRGSGGQLDQVQYTRIEVNGYTDTSGTPKYNMGLSIRRANAVKAELIKDGVPANAITMQGFGETHLLVPTGPGVREPQNRRVEIIIR